ncbi:ArsR/SmtB family transcription factor [Microaceticoccus formicicus]|uniref:ArsR/SmtB family transcription factor n=1 Tax=Microaceticoccus formicicus TaxID=3118105 RepID=UPI003CD04F17|nr:metalloregulator ArsR/SmtB family transcription factor [Peptoniphilaceae bacterium AMB_02]
MNINKSDVCDITILHEEVIEKVSRNMPKDSYLADLADFYKVFGDYTRTRILFALSNAEMCVCDIAVLLDMSQSAISHQLRVLKSSRLVKNRRDGKAVYYSLDDEHIKRILEMGLEHVMEE